MNKADEGNLQKFEFSLKNVLFFFYKLLPNYFEFYPASQKGIQLKLRDFLHCSSNLHIRRKLRRKTFSRFLVKTRNPLIFFTIFESG